MVDANADRSVRADLAGVTPAVTRVVVGVGVSEELVAGRRALSGGDDRPCKENFPHAEHAFAAEVAVLAVKLATQDVFLVGHPVVIPFVQGVGVVAADVLDGVDLESSKLELAHVPVERSGSISSREDVLGHEESPGDVLPVGALAEASDLHQEKAVVLHEAAHTTEVRVNKVSEADVLCHLDGRDLVKLAVAGDVTVVHAQDLSLDVLFCVALVAPFLSLNGEGDTGAGGAEVANSMAGQSAPAASDVQELFSLLQLKLLADEVHLVGLGLFERLVEALEDARGVHHGRAHERMEERVATVVVLCDFFGGGFNVLLRRVAVSVSTLPRQKLLNEPPELRGRDFVVDKLVAVELEDFPAVAALAFGVERNVAVDVELHESSHGDAAVVVRGAGGFIVEDDVLRGLDASVAGVVDSPADEQDGKPHEKRHDAGEQVQVLVDVSVGKALWGVGEEVVDVIQSPSRGGGTEQSHSTDQEDQDGRRVRGLGGHVPSEDDFFHLGDGVAEKVQQTLFKKKKKKNNFVDSRLCVCLVLSTVVALVRRPRSGERILLHRGVTPRC